MNRKVIFDKPTLKVDIDKLPIGAIFLVDDVPYMLIENVIDKLGNTVNSVNLIDGDIHYLTNEDIREYDYQLEYFPNFQNIKIVGD